MRKRKSDFPKITYKFAEKSNYNRGYKKNNILLKLIIVIIFVLAFIYLASFFLSEKYGDDFFAVIMSNFNKDTPSPEPEIIPQEQKTDEKEDKAERRTADDEDKEEEKEGEKEETKKEIDIKTKIELQTAFFGITDEDEIAKMINEYEENTGDNFRDSYMFESDTMKIPDELINSFTKEEASLVRNEIYARRGYIFQGNLKRFYSLKSWYKPKSKAVVLKGIELENMNAIYKYEMSKGWK